MAPKPGFAMGNANLFLAGLPAALRTGLHAHLELVSLNKGVSLYHVGDVVRYGYFPVDGLVSLIASTNEGGTVELTTVGREGAIGHHAFLQEMVAPHQADVRLPGAALRIRTDVLRAETNRHEALRGAVSAYANRASVEVAQAVVCQCFHTVLQRLSRWLLVASDRTGRNAIDITQESLAQVLGAVRPAVTKAAIELQDAASIRYRHGRLFLVNRSILEHSACECYLPQHSTDRVNPEQQ